jgi:hypothetical protein
VLPGEEEIAGRKVRQGGTIYYACTPKRVRCGIEPILCTIQLIACRTELIRCTIEQITRDRLNPFADRLPCGRNWGTRIRRHPVGKEVWG